MRPQLGLIDRTINGESMKKLIWLSVLSLLVTAGCTKKEASSDVTTSAMNSQKELTVGTDAAYAPFEIENSDKSITGFDIDILNAIAAKEGLKLKFVNTPWEGLFTQLGTGDRDILISAITITDERKKVMLFSEPYFEAVQLIAVAAGSKISKFNDLKGVKVGVQTGTTGDEIVSKLLGKTNANIKRFESTPLALQELIGGGVEAVVADNSVVESFAKNNGANFKQLRDDSFSKEYYGIAVKPGNIELVEKINKGLKAIKEDGTYDRIYSKYFSK